MMDINKLAEEAYHKMVGLGYITTSNDVIEKHDEMCRSLQAQLNSLRYSSEVIKSPASNTTQTEDALQNIIMICLGELHKRNSKIDSLLNIK